MRLGDELAKWDGFDVQHVRDIYLLGQDDPDIVDRLIAFSTDPDCEKAAKWILKHGIEAGTWPLNAETTNALISRLGSYQHWASALHVLQICDDFHLTKTSAAALFNTLAVFRTDKSAFVRAWAYYATARVARDFPEYRNDTLIILTDGEKSETGGSVRARIRAARQLLG